MVQKGPHSHEEPTKGKRGIILGEKVVTLRSYISKRGESKRERGLTVTSLIVVIKEGKYASPRGKKEDFGGRGGGIGLRLGGEKVHEKTVHKANAARREEKNLSRPAYKKRRALSVRRVGADVQQPCRIR